MPRMTPIHTSVAAAFFDSGRRNAGTPFEIASTPVSATAPDEKPFRMRKSPSVPPLYAVPSNASLSNGTGADVVEEEHADEPVADERGEHDDVDVRRRPRTAGPTP